jgi:hypothetical protein
MTGRFFDAIAQALQDCIYTWHFSGVSTFGNIRAISFVSHSIAQLFLLFSKWLQLVLQEIKFDNMLSWSGLIPGVRSSYLALQCLLLSLRDINTP